jgi:hypothetical protein
MPAFPRLLLLLPLRVLQAILLLQTILGRRKLAFIVLRPCMPSLIIDVVAMIPSPKLPAMVVQPLLAVRSFITTLSSDTPSN